MTPPSTGAQEYLAAIYEMAEEGMPTVQAGLARWMGLTPASVSEAVKRLKRDGLVAADGRELRFTNRGRELARKIVRRHRLAERFLINVIELPWHQAHQEAEAWEKAISDEVEERLVAILDDPATCPHGNPIPGSKRAVDHRGLEPLQARTPGDRVVLERLTEDLELDLGVMRYFEDNGLMPGAEITVAAAGPDGTLTLEVEGRRVGLGQELADNLWVRPAP
ncbi:MAG TPA: metal-dependent transcriptional regulator [Actinomycetota bacterium]